MTSCFLLQRVFSSEERSRTPGDKILYECGILIRHSFCGCYFKMRDCKVSLHLELGGRSCSFVGLLKAPGFLVCSALPVHRPFCLWLVAAFKQSNMFCTLFLFTSSLDAILSEESWHTPTRSTWIQDNRCPGLGLIKAQFPINDVNAENGLSYRKPLAFNPLIKQCWKSCFALNYLCALTVL